MNNDARIFTVSQVNAMIKAALERSLPAQLIVRGEITGWKRHSSSGHCYFSLKDASGVLPCVMWASRFRTLKFTPEDGMAVLATGHVDVYKVAGKYQLYVDWLEPEGIGALQLAFEQMVAMLRAEGLFEDRHKKPLPPYPQRIAILTSESGAAVHDITESILNRWPCAKILLYPVPVQGEGAAAKIAAAITDLNQRNAQLKIDVLILGRGGGSIEDLWAFNQEVLARAIFDSQIPIVSAVGHEVDVTVADLVADKRASTPTKAGVEVVPDMREVLEQLALLSSRLQSNVQAGIRLAKQRLETLLASAPFSRPLSPVRTGQQQVDELAAALAEATRALVDQAHRRLAGLYEQVARIEPHRLIGRKLVELNDLENRATVGLGALINRWSIRLPDLENRLGDRTLLIVSRRRIELTAAENRLAGLNPRAVLKRGYSITTNKNTGSVVRTPGDVELGDLMITELADENLIESKVTKK